MDALFTEEEMATCCYKNVKGKSTKPSLNQDKVQLLEGKVILKITHS